MILNNIWSYIIFDGQKTILVF